MRDISLKTLMIMPAILLKKPSYKSTSKQHSTVLSRRLCLWNTGNFDTLIREGRAIQSTFRKHKASMTPEQQAKTFANLMLEGKINAALRILDDSPTAGVLSLTDTV